MHGIATEWSKVNRVPIVTTEFILIEVANFFTHPDQRGNFVQLMAAVAADPQTEIIPSSSEWFRNGYNLFAARPDKHWSLTDCTSFALVEFPVLVADHLNWTAYGRWLPNDPRGSRSRAIRNERIVDLGGSSGPLKW